MKGGDPHRADHATDETPHPLAHLVGRLVGEGDGEDGVGWDLEVADQVGDPMGQHPRLARPGSRHDQQRPVGGGDGLALARVEPFEERRVGGLPVETGGQCHQKRWYPRCRPRTTGMGLETETADGRRQTAGSERGEPEGADPPGRHRSGRAGVYGPTAEDSRPEGSYG